MEKKALFLNLYGEKDNKKNVIWNMIASFLYAGQSFLFLLFISRILGADTAGVFSIAFAVASLLQTIAMYGMREFQATDIHEKYKFNHYFWLRMFSNIIMMLFCFLYLLFSGYSREKALVVFWVTIVKGIDSIDNVFNTMFQQQGRLECGSKITAIRILLSYLCFGFAIIVTKDLLHACAIFAIVSLLILFGCIYIIKPILKNKGWRLEKQTTRLALECFPLFLSSFASIYICNLPKYAIDYYLTEEMQGYFAILFLPVNVINLLSTFIFRPALTGLSYAWQGGEYKCFSASVWKQCLWILLITIVLLVVGGGVGLPFLSFFYGVNLTEYWIEFLILLITGGLNALVLFFTSVITTMRYAVKLLSLYILGVCIGTLLSGALTKNHGILGAIILYAIVLFVLVIGFGMFICRSIRKAKENVGRR